MADANPYTPPQSDITPETESPTPGLWNPDAAGAWSLLFSPIFGSVLLLKNWQAMGRPDMAITARIWLIVSVIMFLLTIVSIFTGLIYIIFWYFAWQRPQSKYVAIQLGNNYHRKSWTAPILIGIGSWFGLFLAFLTLGVMSELTSWP